MRPRPASRLGLFVALAAMTVALRTDRLEAQPPARQVTQSVTATATFQPRTSLQVSSQSLRFDVTDATTPVIASVDFSAGARAARSDDVRLLIEAAQGMAGVLTIAEGPDGTIVGQVSSELPTVAARWTGGGLRRGRLSFQLHGVAPGRYEIPLKLLLTIS